MSVLVCHMRMESLPDVATIQFKGRGISNYSIPPVPGQWLVSGWSVEVAEKEAIINENQMHSSTPCQGSLYLDVFITTEGERHRYKQPCSLQRQAGTLRQQTRHFNLSTPVIAAHVSCVILHPQVPVLLS